MSEIYGEFKVTGSGILIDSHEWTSGNNKVILRKSPGSASVGYDLNAAVLPTKRNAAYRGSCLGVVRTVRASTAKDRLTGT